MTRLEAFDKVNVLSKDFLALSFDVSNDDDLNDCIRSRCFSVDIWTLGQFIFTEVLFGRLSEDIEDDKGLFSVHKHLKNFFDDILLPHIDRIIDFSRQYKFHDYRAVNLQREAKDLATGIRNMYIEIYR